MLRIMLQIENFQIERFSIALFKVRFSHLYYNVIQCECDVAMSSWKFKNPEIALYACQIMLQSKWEKLTVKGAIETKLKPTTFQLDYSTNLKA